MRRGGGAGGLQPADYTGGGVGPRVRRGARVGGDERSRGKRSRPEGSGMQSEQCHRQWRKEGRGGGRVCLGWW